MEIIHNIKELILKIIKSFFTLLGGIVFISLLLIGIKYGSSIVKMDAKSLGLYADMADNILTSGDPAKGMIIKRKLLIEDGVTKQEAIDNANEIMDEIADEHGLAKVDVKTMPRGGKFMKDGGLYTQIRSYCSPTIADVFLKHSGEFIGFMPCRVGIVEDEKGDIWLYTMNMDLAIHGGHELPPKMLELANVVKESMNQMIEKGAIGED